MKLENGKHIQELFKRYLNNQCTAEERATLINYFNLDLNEDELKRIIRDELENPSMGDTGDIQTQSRLDDLFQEILKRKSQK